MSRKTFKTDWFNRSSEHDYTFYDPSKRLFNWDDGLDNYSSYFMAKNPVSDAGKFLGSMFRVLGIGKDKKFTITGNDTVEKTRSSHKTDSPVIQVPINMLRDDKGVYVEDNSIVDAFYGASIQNASMATMQTKAEYIRSLELRGYKSDSTKDDDRSDTTKYLASLLNSERIDKKLSDKFPGYLKFVQKYKNHAYSKMQEEDVMAELMKDKGTQLLDLVTKMIRYPADISEDQLEEFAEPLSKIKHLLQSEGGIPDSLTKCESLAGKLSKLLYEIEPPPPGGGGGDSDEDKDGDGDGDSKDGGTGEGEGDKSKGSSKGGKPMDEAARKMMRSLINAGMKDDSVSSKDLKDLHEFDSSTKEADGFEEKGEVYSSTVSFATATEDKESYLRVREKLDMSKAQTLARLFARKNKDYKFSMKSMRSGRLDTDKLAEAVQGVPSIYERIGQVKTNKICVGVLIDESGSMGGGNKMKKAKEAAIFINEIFRKMQGVELFIYGHSADMEEEGTTDMITYREPGKTNMYALGSCRARIENRDGDAILATGMRMRKFTQNAGILFVISDGAPCAHRYNGASAIEDTKQKVIKTEALGLQVIQIAIESSVPSERMFKHFIQMTDIENLPTDMVKFLSRKIDHLIKEKVFV